MRGKHKGRDLAEGGQGRHRDLWGEGRRPRHRAAEQHKLGPRRRDKLPELGQGGALADVVRQGWALGSGRLGGERGWGTVI